MEQPDRPLLHLCLGTSLAKVDVQGNGNGSGHRQRACRSLHQPFALRPGIPCLAMLAAQSRALMRRHCPMLCSFLPHIGRVTIIMNDYPWFKYALIAALGVVVLTSKEG